MSLPTGMSRFCNYMLRAHLASPAAIILVNKKFFFCYVTNEIVILANLGALILKMQLVFFHHIAFLR